MNDWQLLIYSPMKGHVSCSQVLIIMNEAAINICAQNFAWTYIFKSLG